ncbi:S8 family serine peptidase [Stenotrophomonas oahuensis]|uniref:S8 family serine peptidase n=1 Tax=Stenotrophomonas oahuensis TaxID=3003271 RepID=A0ABY9YQN1_9GAMM|nr:S8 family serine peptidase [Stenotrophomonas sp. A5586]WNH52998.1 S8 family serine peptidase [Stenotrophomonas sp. A5586]
MKHVVIRRAVLVSALAVALSACGGGGGGSNVRVDTPTTPTTPPPTTPTPTPTPTRPAEPAINAHLTITQAGAAHSAGLTGAGLKIGVVDSGVMRNHPTLAGRVVANYNYVDPGANNLNIDDVVGHGTSVAELAAGKAVGAWPGGIAPGADIVSARIIADKAPADDGTGNGNEVSGALGLAPIHQDLIAQGVKIMNNSWGGLYWTNPAATSAIAQEYRPFIVSNGGLVVFATGNESKPNPSSMAALPSQAGPGGSRPAADLERGWLSVTAVDSTDPSKLASYANACGVAANYCLAAPGAAVFVDPDYTGASGTTPSYLWNYGTSFAAPLVSGAAALVWQKYPYFSNDLVRQTLLGTATDLGATGVDSTFGHGLLNIAKAINGPAKFDWGTVTVNNPTLGLGSVWSNNITGSGGLIKQGAGSLGLSGTNTYTGDTRIERGTLALHNGASITSNVVIVPQTGSPNGAALQFMGSSRVKGNVDNGAMMIVASATSNAVIDGDYLHREGARLMVSLGSNALSVTGKATIEGGDVHIGGILPGYVAANGRTQTVLHADQGVSGTFFGITNNLTPGTLLEASLSYDPNSVVLTTDRIDVTLASQQANVTGAALRTAGRVESAFELLDRDAGGIIPTSFADGAGQLQQVAGAGALQASLDSLTGQAHALASAMTFDSIDMSRRALSSRFDDVRGTPRLQGAWQSALGDVGQGSFAGSAGDTRGWMIGQDTALGSSGVMGFAFGETRNHSSRSWGSDRGNDRQSQAQLYAGWRLGQGGYALAQLGAGQYTREIDRQLLLGSSAYGVNTRYGGQFSTASMESGYQFQAGGLALTPYLGADYARVSTDGFNEQGGLGFGLRTLDNVSTRSQALAGVRAEQRWRGWSLRGYAEWQQLLSSDGLQSQASFMALDSWSPMAAFEPARSGGLFGVSVQSWLGRSSQLSFGYDQRFGPRGDLSQVALRFATAF